MIGLSLSQSLLRPRQSGVGLDAVGAHGGPGWAHTHRLDSLQSHEPSALLHTRGQPQQPQRMSMASMSQRASIRRASIRRATECPFELLTLDARRLSALAAARRRSSSTRSGSMASNALAERGRGNTTVSAPEAQLQQQQSLLHQTRDVMYLQSIQIDEPPVATSVSGESIATVRRKELNPSGHHEQRRESTSELKRRMRALSKASSCGVILEEPGDTNSDTCTGRLSEESAADAAGAPGEAAVNASASELDRKLASQFDGGNTQSQLKLSSNIEAPQPQNRSRASSSFHEKALFSPLDSYATQVPLRTSLQAIDRQAFVDVDEELLDEVEAQMVPMAAGDFTHARPGDEFRHALFWGVVVAVLLLVSGKLLQWVEGTQEASGVALIASAEKKLEHSLERSFEALFNTCSPNQITNNSEYSGNGSGNGNCRDAVALQNSVSQFVDELRAALEKQIEKKYAIDINQTKWTFANAAFVQWTAITTIGSE